MARTAVGFAKQGVLEPDRFANIVWTETGLTDPATSAGLLQVSHGLSEGIKHARENLSDLVIVGPRLAAVDWQGLVRLANIEQPDPQGLWAKAALLSKVEDTGQLLAQAAEIAASFAAPHGAFALLCDEVTGEPLIESLYPKVWQQRDLGCVINDYLEADATTGDGPHLLIIPVIHKGHLEALLGMACPPGGDDASARSLTALHSLSHLAAPLFSRLRDLDRLRSKAEYLGAVLETQGHALDNICHEFRSALAAIKGYTQRMLHARSGPLTDAQYDDLTVIQTNTNRLLDLAGYTLPFLAQQRPRPGSFDLREVWQPVLKRIRFRMEEKPIEFIERIPAEPLMITADRERLAVALEIVLTNAVNWAVNTSVIAADLKRGAYGEATVTVLVPGTTLPRQLLDKIFEHQQEPPSACDEDHAQPAGLALAHDLIWLNGGRLAVRSNAEEGTLFALTLPQAANP